MRSISKGNNKKQQGFTLIELMIVVAVVSIVATVAIPGLIAAKKRANEASTITALRTISSVQSQYRIRYGSFGNIPDLDASGMLDDNFADFQKSGYVYANALVPSPGSWALTAEPLNPGASGDRYFFIDTTGVIRFNETQTAGTGDTPIE